MGNFFTALKLGVNVALQGPEPERFEVGGRPVRCPHCANETFVDGKALLNTRGMTFMNLDWANNFAYTLVCAECGRIEWFAQTADVVST